MQIAAGSSRDAAEGMNQEVGSSKEAAQGRPVIVPWKFSRSYLIVISRACEGSLGKTQNTQQLANCLARSLCLVKNMSSRRCFLSFNFFLKNLL